MGGFEIKVYLLFSDHLKGILPPKGGPPSLARSLEGSERKSVIDSCCLQFPPLTAIHYLILMVFHFLIFSHLHPKSMNVIGLYPNLVPGGMRQKVAEQHPTKPPTLSGTDGG